jgi:hypothetical protein
MSSLQYYVSALLRRSDGWLEWRERGCRDALPDSFEVVVGSVKGDASDLRELSLEDRLGGGQHQVATCTFGHAPQYHHMVDLVELRIPAPASQTRSATNHAIGEQRRRQTATYMSVAARQ